MDKTNAIGILIAIIFCGIGVLVGWQIASHKHPVLPAPTEYRVNTTPQNTLIDPLLYIDTDQRFFPEYNGLDAKINSYVGDAQNSGKASSVSVYLRELNSGHWTGTDENETFEPSSMLKVAVLISYLKAAIQDKSILTKQLKYPGTDQTGQYYISTSTLPAGYYSVQELLDKMIVDSDNSAALTLISDNQDQFQSVYNDFRLPPTPGGNVADYMTTKAYSVIFRSLYNASYLTRTYSQQALTLLTKTDFNKGLATGLPPNTLVAHKFGEHTYALADRTPVSHELHDCGIIYYPNDPYLLCVMTKGQNFSDLEKVVGDISKMIYDFVVASSASAK